MMRKESVGAATSGASAEVGHFTPRRTLAETIGRILRRPVVGSTAARRRPVEPRKMHFEALEPRLLLSADLMPGFDQVAFQQGTLALEDFGERIAETRILSQILPLVDLSPGAILGANEIFRSLLTDPVHDFFGNPHVPTSAALASAIRDTGAGVSVVDESTDSEVRLHVTFSAVRQADLSYELEQSFGASAAPIEGMFTAPATVTFGFDADIGVDRGQASASEAFFLEFNPSAGNFITFDVHDANVAFDGSLGFLDVEVSGGSVDLDLDLTLNSAALPPRALALALASDDAATLMPLELGNPIGFQMVLPVAVADLVATPIVDVASGEILLSHSGEFENFDFDNALGTTTLTELLSFTKLSSAGVYGVLDELGELFEQTVAGGPFSQEIPFTDGTTFGEVLDIDQAFANAVLGKLDSDVPGGSFAFESAQELVSRLGIKDVTFDPDFSTGTTTTAPALLFTLDVSHIFEVLETSVGFELDLGKLAGFDVDPSSTVELKAELGVNVEVGLLLTDVGFKLVRDTPDTPIPTKLSSLNRGLGIFPGDPTDPAHFRITLSSGAQLDVNLDALAGNPDASIENVIAAIEAEVTAQTLTVALSRDGTGLSLTDHTFVDGVSTPGLFKIAGTDGSLVAVLLGIAGTGDAGVIGGKPLHGATLFDNAFIRQVDSEPMLTGSVRLQTSPDGIDALARLGFVEVAITDGQAVGAVNAELSLSDPGTEFDGRVTFQEAFDALGEAALRVTGDIVGVRSGTEIHLPGTMDFDGLSDFAGVLELVGRRSRSEPRGRYRVAVRAVLRPRRARPTARGGTPEQRGRNRGLGGAAGRLHRVRAESLYRRDRQPPRGSTAHCRGSVRRTADLFLR